MPDTTAPLENSRAAYAAELQAMTDAQLLERTKRDIWRSAYAANNPRSAFHWQCDLCYDEAVRRGQPDIYERAYNAVAKREGFR